MDDIENDILGTLGEDKIDNVNEGTNETDKTTNDAGQSSKEAKQDSKAASKEESAIDAAVERAANEGETPAKSGDKAAGKGNEEKPKGKEVSSPQDIVDAQGNVIAKGGRERRFYETAQREKLRADKTDAELRKVSVEVEALRSANAIGTQLKLAPQEMVTAAHLMHGLKTNPVETAKYILTQLQAAGHTIEGIGAGTDAGALRAMIAEMISPLTREREQTQQQQEVERKAGEQYKEFVAHYPDVVVHDETIARLLDQDPNLSPEAAYYKLRSFYAERSLDFTKSLATLQTELDAKAKGAAQGDASVGADRRSIPSGGTPASTVVSTDEASFGATARYDDIIKSALRDAGMSGNI